ncbi:MAG: DUF4358 domain-containing protein [Anaerofustis stercorihominis]|nr:DUF4358 domain-containing protein [Anaerofustis stercorihominis]
MKKRLSIFLSVVFVLMTLTACSGDGADTEPITKTIITYTLKEGVTISDIVTDAANDFGFTMPMNVSEKTLESMFYIPSSAVSEFDGKFTISASSADNFVVVKVIQGKESVIEHGFEQRKQDLLDTFSGYIQQSYDQANNSQLIIRGDYYIFSSLDCDAEMLTTFVDSYFDMKETTVTVESE